ncbi:MAG: Tad domain-containing protein, partial [Chloroflexi bacterium]|nr:Tad domain-containing protein [Chloroflexota bacterium]
LFWALSFIGILAFFVIVADAGLVFLERRSLQNVADASALAGARELYLAGALAGEAEAIQFASESDGDLTGNSATASNLTAQVSSTVQDDSASIFGGGFLGFGSPSVSATATARVAASVLPGPGVFCVGTHIETVTNAQTINSEQLPAPLQFVWQLPYGDPLDDPPLPGTLLGGDPGFYTILRFGAGSGSNAGYVDIGDEGGASQAVRRCFQYGSAQGLQAVEPTQTGISAGPAAQGLQARLQAARDPDRNCYTWEDIRTSLLAADFNDDATLEAEWRCSPYVDQNTSVVLIPVTTLLFTEGQGSSTVDIYFDGDALQYELAYFWLDAERTFADTDANRWKFDGPQGQIEIEGVFLSPFLTELIRNDGSGSGGTVACVAGQSQGCFLELIR